MAAAELRGFGGCVFVNLIQPQLKAVVCCCLCPSPLGEPLFQGKGELDQIKKIFALLGTPTQVSVSVVEAAPWGSQM